VLITFSKQAGKVPVTVMHLTGNLDASNYTEVISRAQEIHQGGARNLLIDFSKVPYISSAGLMCLHTIVLIFGGQATQSKLTGRPAFRPINLARDGEVRKHVKLLNPQSDVEQVLDVVGLKQFFEIYNDLDTAIQSF
jgi:anti-anti-sigma regulatory factor